MVGHPLQMGITVLFIMAMCGIAGRIMPENGTASAWIFFGAFFVLIFGVLWPAQTVYSRCSRRRY